VIRCGENSNQAYAGECGVKAFLVIVYLALAAFWFCAAYGFIKSTPFMITAAFMFVGIDLVLYALRKLVE